MASEDEVVWAPPPCGIVLEASGPECHEAEGPRAAPKWIFFGGGGIPVCITDSPSKLFKVAFDCFYFILCRDFFFSIKYKTIGILKYWKELFQVLAL